MHPRPKKWFPKHPKKYLGDVNKIIVRSSWETKVLNHCDNNSRVIAYSSEEVIIPYISPVDKKAHRYFTDMFVVFKDDDGTITKYIVEVKPAAQRVPPKVPKRMTPRYLTELKTYSVNQSKWKAAEAYCKKRKWKFIIVDENHALLKTLNKTKNKFK